MKTLVKRQIGHFKAGLGYSVTRKRDFRIFDHAKTIVFAFISEKGFIAHFLYCGFARSLHGDLFFHHHHQAASRRLY